MYRLFLTTLITTILFLAATTVAEAASLYLAPAGGTYSVGSTLSIEIRAGTHGEAANTVGVYLSYPADKLGPPTINRGGSALSLWTEQAVGDGQVRITGGQPTPGFSGDKLVAKVSFRVLATGSASLSFASGSAVVSNATNQDILTRTAGASFNLTPAPSPTPRDEIPPVISGLVVSQITKDTVTIAWETDELSGSLVEYGLTRDYGFSVYRPELATTHEMVVENLPAGTTFYYRITSKDEPGNAAVVEIGSFTTLGYLVKVRVTDRWEKPVFGVEVVLYSQPQTVTTSSEGVATFENVSAGKHGVVVRYPGATRAETIEVQAQEQEQVFEVKAGVFVEAEESGQTAVASLVGQQIFGSRLLLGVTGLVALLAAVGVNSLLRVTIRAVVKLKTRRGSGQKIG